MTYKEVLDLVQPHFGGSGTTSTQGSIAPELRGLYQSSADALVGQQEQNNLGQYNEAHPQQTAEVNPLQQYATSMMMGGNLPTGLDAMALQGIMRQSGLAGAGPTSGQYDYGSEAGLGDMQAFMNPAMGVMSGEDGFAFPRNDQTGNLPNVGPNGAPDAPDYNLSDVLAPPTPAPGGGNGLPTGNGGGPQPDLAGWGSQGGPGGQQPPPPPGGGGYLSDVLQRPNVNPEGGAGAGPFGANSVARKSGLTDEDIAAAREMGAAGQSPGLGPNNYQFEGGRHDMSDFRNVLRRAGMDENNPENVKAFHKWVGENRAAKAASIEDGGPMLGTPGIDTNVNAAVAAARATERDPAKMAAIAARKAAASKAGRVTVHNPTEENA